MRALAIASLWVIVCLQTSFIFGQGHIYDVSNRPKESTEQPLFSIGLVADPQYCDAHASKGRFYRLSLEKLTAAIDTFESRSVDFVLGMGDMIDQWPQSFQPVKKAFEGLNRPVHHLLGNHEFWEIPNNQKRGLKDSLGMHDYYCEFAVDGWRLLLLDGTELAKYAQVLHPEMREESDLMWEGVHGKGNAKIWNGGIGAIQMAWLKERLAFAAYHEEKVLIFCHFPIAPASHHLNLWNSVPLRRLIERSPATVAWIAGHNHKGSYRNYNGVHYLTLRGMVMTADSNAFSILHVYPDKIEVEGFGREPFRRLSLRDRGISELHLAPPEEKWTPPAKIICVERRMRNMAGQVILHDEVPDIEAEDFENANLSPGLYDLEVIRKGKRLWKRVFVLHTN